MAIIEQDPNARFEKAMFNLLRSFNFIDHNLGMCISFLAKHLSPENADNKLSNMSFNQRMKWFEKLMTESELGISEKAKNDFTDWLSHADEARKLRNVYVHAVWRFNPMKIGKPVSISSPPWMREKLGDDMHLEMSLDELESRAIIVEKVFKNFINIRDKHKI